MKIYTKIVIDMATMQTVEAEGHEYEGPVALCDFGTSVDAPPPPEKDQTQKDLEAEQLDQLKKANLYSDLVTPVTLANAGYKTVTDPDGTQRLEMMTPEERLGTMSPLDRSMYEYTLRGMGLSSTGERLTEEQIIANMTDAERRNYELEKAYAERQQAALSGTLPISPALEKDLADQEKALTDSLAARLGPNWQLSTPGIKAMSDFKQRADLLREEARRGQISTGEALIASRSQDVNTQLNPTLSMGDYMSTVGGSTGNKLYSVPQLYSAMTGVTGSVIAPYQNERMQVYNNNVSAAMQSSANKAALYGSLISGASKLGGAAIAKWG